MANSIGESSRFVFLKDKWPQRSGKQGQIYFCNDLVEKHPPLYLRFRCPGRARFTKNETMESDQRQYLSEVINYFWGEGTTSPESVNQGMAAIAYEALEEAQSCSAAMVFVPRPVSGRPGAKYILKQVAKVGKQIASGDTQMYETCRQRVAVNFRIQMEMAKQGL